MSAVTSTPKVIRFKRSTTEQPKLFTVEQYFKREEKSKYKSHFINGEIIKMAGGSFNHNQISAQIISSFIVKIKLLSEKYKVSNSDQKVFIPSKNSFLYPDALVISGQPEYWEDRKDTITNPLIIVEVLSDATEKFDFFQKFYLYQEIPSFQEYIIVSQKHIAIEQWYKSGENTWTKSNVDSNDGILKIKSIPIEIPLSEIYDDVEF
jgi:Uma2 family endonuclease